MGNELREQKDQEQELVDTLTEILASCLSTNDVRPRVNEVFDGFKEAGWKSPQMLLDEGYF